MNAIQNWIKSFYVQQNSMKDSQCWSQRLRFIDGYLFLSKWCGAWRQAFWYSTWSPGQKHWSNPSLQTKFRNSIQCLYRKQFQRQPAHGQYQCLVENQLDPLIVLFPAWVANDHEAFCQKNCRSIFTIAFALQFFVCSKSLLCEQRVSPRWIKLSSAKYVIVNPHQTSM